MSCSSKKRQKGRKERKEKGLYVVMGTQRRVRTERERDDIKETDQEKETERETETNEKAEIWQSVRGCSCAS